MNEYKSMNPLENFCQFFHEVPEVPDELQFCDEDIALCFRNKVYYVGTPTLVQINRTLKGFSMNLKTLLEEKSKSEANTSGYIPIDTIKNPNISIS